MHLDPSDIDLRKLTDHIRETGKPVHINQLARTAVTCWLENNVGRQYAPGNTYKVKDTVELNGRSATITDIQAGYNPKQGTFQILTLTVAEDGSVQQLAAGIEGASNSGRDTADPEAIQNELEENGLAWRTAVQKAMAENDRFVHFQDEQGDQWCLLELLPMVTEDEVRRAWGFIQSATDGAFGGVPTERLAVEIWGVRNDGSDEYALLAFALSAALFAYREVQYVAGAGWMPSERWRQLGERPSLVSPRLPNVLPEATVEDEEEEDESTAPVADRDQQEAEQVSDIEAWRQQRISEATFTLRANHYYYHWLPLASNLARLFPPRSCRITIYYSFEVDEGSFTAVVNPEQSRVLADREFYDVLVQNGIYPGARLVISHRGNDYQYDIRTRPVDGERSVTVRRIAIDEEGKIESWEDEERLRYEVDGDVFVADARWEDLPALFQQAEEVGKGFFSLMFDICRRWQKERGSPLVVTAEELFEAIHYDVRPTSKATIAWELWGRLAFKSVGQGRYEFREEYGDRRRSHGLKGRRSSPSSAPSGKRGREGRSLPKDAQEIHSAKNEFTADELWTALKGNEEQWSELETAVSAYKANPFREKMLFMREAAHRRIRELLAPDKLGELTLPEFNEQIWQLGTVAFAGHRARIGSAEIENLLQEVSLQEMKEAYETGRLVLVGNQTWGSATSLYGTQLKRRTDVAKTKLLRDTIRHLLYGEDDDEKRIATTIQASNGFGINITSGLLHAAYPEQHILYNRRSVAMLTSLNIAWPSDWRRNATVYLAYRDLAQLLLQAFQFSSLTDVDWFVFGWGNWQKAEETAATHGPVVDDSTSRPRFEVTKTGQMVATDLVSLGPLFEEALANEASESPATGHFIFQQKPESEYDDQTGAVYNWRQGIPGSKQIQPGARFIYYRPGEKVFFGCGRIEWIETRRDEDGRTIYDGQIADYEAWKPPMPLSRSLARQLSFVDPKQLGIGQAGIRKINPSDFETIRRAYRYFVSQRATGTTITSETPGSSHVDAISVQQNEFNQMRTLITAQLKGKTIYTLTGKANIIQDVSDTGLLVRSGRGEAEVAWEWIREIYDKLIEQGGISAKELREEKPRLRGTYRSAFIFGLLVQFKHISAQLNPIRIFYKSPNVIELRSVKYSVSASSAQETEKSTDWTEEKIIARFQGIRTWQQGEKSAPHKPLLLLYALARCKRGDARLIPYSEIDEVLTELLIRFNPQIDQQRTEYPFWRLQNDGLWEVQGADQFSELDNHSNPRKKELLDANVAGGFPSALFEKLRAKPSLIEQLTQALLNSYWPAHEHQAVRQAIESVTARGTSPVKHPPVPAQHEEDVD